MTADELTRLYSIVTFCLLLFRVGGADTPKVQPGLTGHCHPRAEWFDSRERLSGSDYWVDTVGWAR